MSWDYGRLATEVYELDKPVGRSFGAVEYYARRRHRAHPGAGHRNRARAHQTMIESLYYLLAN